MSEQSNSDSSKAKRKQPRSLLLKYELLRENWIDGMDPLSSPADLSNYVSLKFDEYGSMKNFQNWDFTTFAKVRLPILQRFRKLPREHGIYIRKSKVYCSVAITEALQSPYREWTQSEVEEIVKDKTFNYVSGKLQYLEEQFHAENPKPKEFDLLSSTILGSPMNIDTISPKSFGRPINSNHNIPNLTPNNPPPEKLPPSNPPPNKLSLNNHSSISYQLGNLSKLYNEDMKYNGEEANFDFKLTIFLNTCQRASLQENNILVVFPIMLKAFRDHFEGEELRRNVLDEWNSLTLQQTKNMNTEKSFQACFDLMLQRIRALQHGLRKELRNDYFLHNEIITACKSIEACSYACFKPSESVTGLINDIRSSISTWESCHPAPNTNSTFPDINFVDHELDESKSQYFERMGRPKIFNKRFQQFIQDYELQLTTENLDYSQIFMEQLENLVLEPQTDTEIQPESDSTSSSIFLTSVGPVDGDIVVQNLTNKSFTHALTTCIDETDVPSK
ncbi:hypothetical protein GcM3_015039 [Golovinomyces cichoracearum]|uniref:Uncharacterized protein n=1 Tax=Golovinomyces cichoracearum TaxID=62708 RepID=A0A420J8Z5_9PEZI|nr:hypothetical protein GcM3_015039 [Golovinomyces cichoracearum]